MSNVGRWDQWYSTLDGPRPYGDTRSYALGAKWLAPCSLVEDWGCGGGFMSTLIGEHGYRGLDGSKTPYAAAVVDLREYRSQAPGIFMRHVLEHDYGWADILDNFCASFTQRACLVLFTPMAEHTHEIHFEDPPGVPVLGFREADITERFPAGVAYQRLHFLSATQFGEETAFLLERR